MNSFFYQTAQTLINQYPDRFALLKITHIINWQAIKNTLNNQKYTTFMLMATDPLTQY